MSVRVPRAPAALLLLLLATPASSQLWITTFSGTKKTKYTGDGIPAANATLSWPQGVAFMPTINGTIGDVLIGDCLHQRVRRVSALTGLISTIAGTGHSGFSGDGGPAVNATVQYPEYVVGTLEGHVYFSDMGNNRVRLINGSTGIITTVAGTGGQTWNGDGIPATTANIYNPSGIAINPRTKTLYIVDYVLNRVRWVNASTQLIYTLAGTGATGYNGDSIPASQATLYSPIGVALDSVGNVYISDQNNCRVRLVNATTGIISTFVGTGAAGDPVDGVPATASPLRFAAGVSVDAFNNIWVADNGNRVIRVVNHTTGMINTVAGSADAVPGYDGDNKPATSASLNYPTDVAVSPHGELVLIADQQNNRIRAVAVRPTPSSTPSPTSTPSSASTPPPGLRRLEGA